jgi:hypothetical protein
MDMMIVYPYYYVRWKEEKEGQSKSKIDRLHNRYQFQVSRRNAPICQSLSKGYYDTIFGDMVAILWHHHT